MDIEDYSITLKEEIIEDDEARRVENGDYVKRSDEGDKRPFWTQSATVELIKTYKDNRELWDIKHALYKDKASRLTKIEAIAAKFSTTPEAITKKIHNLRSQFNTELRKIKKKHNGEGCLQGASGWDYFDMFLFLVRDQDPLGATVPIENVNIELAEFQAEEELEFGAAARAQRSAVRSPAATRPVVRVAASAPPPLPQSAHPMFWPEQPQPKIRPGLNADECQIFGDFVASELRTLRSDESRKRLKRIIQKAILKIGEEEDVNIISG